MTETSTGRIRLRSEPDAPWKVGLLTGVAAGWNFRAIPHGRDELLPHEKEHVAEVNTARVRKLIEGLREHPMQCGYAIGMLDARAADLMWAMHVVRYHLGPKAAAVVELVKRGAPREWAREMLAGVPLDDMSLDPCQLIQVGLIDVARAEEMVERMPSGSGRAAIALLANGHSKLSWVMRVVLADPQGRPRNIELVNALKMADRR